MSKKQADNNREGTSYAHFTILGSPVSKSNFALHNKDGKKIMPRNTGDKKYDKYGDYEDLIVQTVNATVGDVQFKNGIIAQLIIYYKYEKKHPDTNNMPKSMFDGIEKSGLVINDIMVKHIFLTERYDKENPRVEVHLYDDTEYEFEFTVKPINPSNASKENKIEIDEKALKYCVICKGIIADGKSVLINGGTDYACTICLKKEVEKKSRVKKDLIICTQCRRSLPRVEARKLKGKDEYVCLRCVLGG